MMNGLTYLACAQTWTLSFTLVCPIGKNVDARFQSVHYHIREFCRSRHLLTPNIFIPLANALVSSRLDYCNCLFTKISKFSFSAFE